MGDGAGFLETPTYILVVVFVIFLIMQIAFEKGLHWLKHTFEHHHMYGLLAAVHHMVIELALLAFISLFLFAIEYPISSICVPKYSDEFQLLHNVHECSSCLEETDGVQIPPECKYDKSPYRSSNYTRRLLAGSSDKGYQQDCEDGKQPLISSAAFHHIHIFIFMLAICHIVAGAIMILLATWRLRRWRSVTRCDQLDAMVHESIAEYHENIKKASSGMLVTPEVEGEDSQKWKKIPSKLVIDQRRAQKQEYRMDIFGYQFVIWFKCFCRQFYRGITTHEFNLMRSSFIFTHKLKRDFQFIEYLLRVMEYDFAEMVGISNMMWILLILIILISGPLGWLDMVGCLIGIVVMLAVNTVLQRVTYEVTCTGTIQSLEKLELLFWFNRPWMLLTIIRYAIFLNTIGFASKAFFAWQFGTRSCYFQNDNFITLSVPWYVCLVLNILLMLQLGLVTLPLYTVAAQLNSGAKWQTHLLSEGVKERLKETLEQIRNRKKNNGSSGSTKNLTQLSEKKGSTNSSNDSDEASEVQANPVRPVLTTLSDADPRIVKFASKNSHQTDNNEDNGQQRSASSSVLPVSHPIP